MVTDICKSYTFVTDRNPEWSVPLSRVVESAHERLRPLASSLLHNLESVHQIAGLPLTLSISGAKDQRYALLQASEKIRATYELDGRGGEDKSSEAIRKRASQALERELGTPEGSGAIADIAIDKVEILIRDETFLKTAQELLRQSTVLTWGALEVLAEDVFETILNCSPILVERLRVDEGAKKLFSFKSISFETLEDSGFDLSKKLGSVLLDIHRIDSIPSMKTVFGALYKRDSSVLATLSNPRLFELNQRRHIIVHRLGIVDEEYIRRSKDNLQVGSQLLVKASDLSRYLDAVRDAGISLLEAGFVALKEVDA